MSTHAINTVDEAAQAVVSAVQELNKALEVAAAQRLNVTMWVSEFDPTNKSQVPSGSWSCAND